LKRKSGKPPPPKKGRKRGKKIINLLLPSWTSGNADRKEEGKEKAILLKIFIFAVLRCVERKRGSPFTHSVGIETAHKGEERKKKKNAA